MFVTGPDVVKTVTHETVTSGATGRRHHPHVEIRRCHCAFKNDIEALLYLRRFVDFLPGQQQRKTADGRRADPWDRVETSLDTLIPDNPTSPMT